VRRRNSSQPHDPAGRVKHHMQTKRVNWPHSWLYPELLLFRTDEARKRATRKATKEIFLKSPRVWLAGIALVAVFEACFFLLLESNVIPWPAKPVIIPFMMIAFGFVGGIWIVFPISKCRRFLRQRLSEEGIPICIECSYDLTGNASGICPECGTPVPEDFKAVLKE
jgi:hypothetical protein